MKHMHRLIVHNKAFSYYKFISVLFLFHADFKRHLRGQKNKLFAFVVNQKHFKIRVLVYFGLVYNYKIKH